MNKAAGENFRGKKVLIFGLGLLGGGVATTNWFLRHGAAVTVTDLKTRAELKPSIKKIKGRVQFALGGHQKADIRKADVVALNQDVAINNPFVQFAFHIQRPVETEGTLFFKLFPKKIVAVTGTRGKTTTVTWLDHFLSSRYRSSTAGNTGPRNTFLDVLDKAGRLEAAVCEVPSFQLEYFGGVRRSPDVAVITNLYQDHLNRHGTLRGYAHTKANLFHHQNPNQHLILNADDAWTPFFLKQKPKSRVWFFSAGGKLAVSRNGLLFKNGAIHFQEAGKKEKVFPLGSFVKERGAHNLENLLASSLAAYLAGCSWADIKERIKTLPQVPFRQEVIFKSKRLTIINDTTATSPEGAIAAVKRFGGPNAVLIAGGTDRALDFRSWGRIIPKHIKPENLVFLTGSATKKMLQCLPRRWHAQTFETLAESFSAALTRAREVFPALVVFSPGAKSFELFANEYDRGEKFSRLVKEKVR